jgi:hypothetical protein
MGPAIEYSQASAAKALLFRALTKSGLICLFGESIAYFGLSDLIEPAHDNREGV